jgi:hypothetical protein
LRFHLNLTQEQTIYKMLVFNRLRVFQKKGFEKFVAQSFHFFQDLDAWIRNGCQSKSLLLLPKYPSKKTSIYKIAKNLHLSILNHPHPSNVLGIYFSDETNSNPMSLDYNYPIIKILNKDCLDISKKKVDAVHQKVFGYNTIIDPFTYDGRAIIKSDDNAKHDGVEILFPIEQIAQDKIYQMIIDNQVGDLYLDYRVCVINREIPIFYKKYKSKEKRYTNDVLFATVGEYHELPENVREKIILFAQEMHCEFCELDVLKDNKSNRWFIIDLNKTPYGPPAPLNEKDKKKSIQILSECFKKNFLV